MPQIHDRKEYRAFPALNQSAAKHLLVSAAHYQAYINAPHEETKALRFGTYVHAAVLEPETLDDLYVTAPDCDRRTKEGKALWSEFATANAGKTILDAEEAGIGHLVAAYARLALKNHGVKFDETEVMYHVDYNGIPLKAAIDGVAGDYLWDIKTTDDASAAGMLKAIRNYRYNLQAYWYRLVYELATGKRPLGFRFLFVEKEPPYATAVCEIGPELMSWAVSDFEKAVNLYRECSASGVWPAYPDDVQVIDVKTTTTATPITFA
jgi:exodeoxyribonuclease VIII